MKHLIVFSYDYPPSNGGIARLCQEIAVGAQQYYDNVVVLTRKKDTVNIPYNYFEVEIVELPSQRIKCEIAAIKCLRKIKNKNKYDVLCGIWHPEGLLSIVSGFRNVYILGHGTEFLYGNSKFRKYFWLPLYAKFILNKVSKVITNSHYTAGLVKSITPKANVTPLPLAVNHEFFKPLALKKNNNKLKLCSVSRILQFKGHDFVIRTIASLPPVYQSNIECRIAGSGSYLPELKQLVKQLNLEKIVFFEGFIADKDLPTFYNSNDVFILCTRESSNSTEVEGFGLVFLEAQSSGIPAIGTNTGGIPDAIENGNGGWLIEQDNQQELSSLLIYLLDNKNIITQMGEKARKRVEVSATWDNYNNILFKSIFL